MNSSDECRLPPTSGHSTVRRPTGYYRPVPAVRSIDGRMSGLHDMVEQTEMAKPVAETWYGLEPCSVGMIRVREVHGRPLPFR